MGGTKNRPHPTAKQPTTIQERSTTPSPSITIGPQCPPTVPPTAPPTTVPPSGKGPKNRREGPARGHFTVALLALAGLAVLLVLLTTSSLAWTRNTTVAAACNFDAVDGSLLQLAFCAFASRVFPRHHHDSGGVPKQGPTKSFDDIVRGGAVVFPQVDDAYYSGPALRPEAVRAYHGHFAPIVNQPRKSFDDIVGCSAKAAAQALGKAVLHQLEGDTDPSLRLNAARAYKERLCAFEGGAVDPASVDALERGLFDFVKEHLNFKHAVCTESPNAAYYPFNTEAEWLAAMRMIKRSHSRKETEEILHSLHQMQVESLNRVGCADAQSSAISVDDLHRGLDLVPTIPFYSTPIPSDILAGLKATKKPVADFVHCSPVLRLQEKVLDPRLVGKINWRCAVQRNDEGERVLAGVETGDAAIAAQQKFCKNEKEHVLILFLYADKTCVTGDSRTSYWPIYLELANLHDKARMIKLHVERHSLGGPMLVGFIPVVSGQGTKIAQARLQLYQFCMSTLIQDLKTACGGLRFHAHFGAEPELECRVCYPLLLAFEADHPETKMCCCLKGGTTKRPCNMCHEAHKNLHKLQPDHEPCARSHVDLDSYFAESQAFADMEKNLAYLLEQKQITKSRHDSLIKHAREKLQSERNLLHAFSAHDVEPAFSELGYLEPYQAMAIDLMHLLDLGLIPRMLLLTARYWHCARKKLGGVEELNLMWCRIASDASSRPDDLRRIINGPLFKYEKKNKIEVASVPKAEEYRAVLQLFPHLVVDEPAVYAVWVALQDFYAKAHEGSFTTKSMIELDAAALRLQKAFEESPLNTCAASSNKSNKAVLPKGEQLENKCAVCGEGAKPKQPLRLCSTEECCSTYHASCLGLRGHERSSLPSCPCCCPGDFPTFVLLSERVHPLQIIKFHMLSHMASAIRLFGALVNTRVSHLEAFHRELKRAFRRSNRTRAQATRQCCNFFANRSRLETINMYQHCRALQGLETAESVLPPRPRNGKRCCDSSNPDVPVSKKQRKPSAPKTAPVPRTRPGGCFYDSKDTIVPTLQLQDDAPVTPISGCLQFPWGSRSLQPTPPPEVRGVSVAEVLKKELLEFQQRHIDPTSASLLAESLSLQLFGYITLVKDGHSLGRLHAVNHWKGGTATGKFNGVRIHPSRGRSKDLEYARLLLVFKATLCDGNAHELALVRNHALVRRSKTIASVECSDVYLSETGCSVIRVTDIVDGWNLLPDFTGGFAAAMAAPDRLVAGNYLL